MQLHHVGGRAVLVEVSGSAEALDLALWSRGRIAADEIVPAATTVLYDGLHDSLDGLRRRLEGWTPGSRPDAGAEVEVPVTYDGADLDAVAELWGTDRAGVAERHQSLGFVSAFCGFAPGFAYLAGLPDELAVPRLDTPRSKVPPGSVALAGDWCAVYPAASPGGWRLIGTTGLSLWDLRREPPALLAPGTRVRFVERR